MTGGEIINAAFARFQAQVGGSESGEVVFGTWPLWIYEVLYELPVIAYRRGGILAFAAPFFCI